MPFHRFDELAGELKNQIYKEALTYRCSSNGEPNWAPNLLLANKEVRSEAAQYLWDQNTVHVDIESNYFGKINFAFSEQDKPYETIVEVTFAGVTKRMRFNSTLNSASDSRLITNVFDFHAWWPDCVRKAANVRLFVVLNDCRFTSRGQRPRAAPECPFAPVSQLTLSLAHAAVSCKKLNVEVACGTVQGGSATKHLADVEKVLAGAAAFANVEKCGVILQGNTSEREAQERLRATITGPVPMPTGRPLTRVLELVERSERALSALARMSRTYGPYARVLGTTLLAGTHPSACERTRTILYMLKDGMFRNMYLPYLPSGPSIAADTLLVNISGSLNTALYLLENFLQMHPTQTVLAWDAQMSGRSEEESEGAVFLPSLTF